jgi:hypothetical protein
VGAKIAPEGRNLPWRSAHAARIVAPQAISRDLDQCLDPSVTTTLVGSGSCGSRRFRLASLQLATFTTLANCEPEPISP